MCSVSIFVLLCFTLLQQSTNGGTIPEKKYCDPASGDCDYQTRLKRKNPDQCEGSTLNFTEGVCTPLWNCPLVLCQLQSFDDQDIKTAQQNFCDRRPGTLDVCCKDRINRRLDQTSADSEKLPIGSCGLGGRNMIKKLYFDFYLYAPAHQGKTCEDYKRRKRGTEEELCRKDRKKRMIGGVPARMGQFPWLSVMYLVNSPFERRTEPDYGCMGSIVNERFILTSVYCMRGTEEHTKMKPTYFTVGEYDLTRGYGGVYDQVDTVNRANLYLDIKPQLFEIEDIVNHYNYTAERGYYNDALSLIKLESKIHYNEYVQPVCLPTKSEKPDEIVQYRGSDVIVAGYGFSGGYADVGVPRREKMEIEDISICQNWYKYYFRDVNVQLNKTALLCVGGRGATETGILCGKEMGSPLMQQANDGRMFLTGVKNHLGHKTCGQTDRPNVYMRVEPFMDWIASIVTRAWYHGKK